MNDFRNMFAFLFLPILGPAAVISCILVGSVYIFLRFDMNKEIRNDIAKAQAKKTAKTAAAANRANPDYVDPRAIRLEQLRPKLRTGDAALFEEYDAIRKDMIENPDNLPV